MRSDPIVLRELYQLMVAKYGFPLRTIDNPVDFEGKDRLDALAFPKRTSSPNILGKSNSVPPKSLGRSNHGIGALPAHRRPRHGLHRSS